MNEAATARLLTQCRQEGRHGLRYKLYEVAVEAAAPAEGQEAPPKLKLDYHMHHAYKTQGRMLDLIRHVCEDRVTLRQTNIVPFIRLVMAANTIQDVQTRVDTIEGLMARARGNLGCFVLNITPEATQVYSVCILSLLLSPEPASVGM